MKKPFLKIFIVVALFIFSPLSFSKEESPPSPAGLFKGKKIEVFGAPIVDQKSDEGLTLGALPVIILSDKESEAIQAIFGMSGQYNSTTKVGGSIFGQIFFDKESELSFEVEVSERHYRGFDIAFSDEHLFPKIFFAAKLNYLQHPFGRFFGIGAETIESNESNFKPRYMNADMSVGYYVTDPFRIQVDLGYHKANIYRGVLSEVRDTLVSFPNLPNITDSTNFIQGLGFVYDRRNDGQFSERGNLLSASYFVSHDNLGSDKTFHGWKFDAIQFIPWIKERMTTAVRVSGKEVFGGNTPFYELSSLGGKLEFRGYLPGRFIDQGKLLFQVEQRIKVFEKSIIGKNLHFYVDPYFEGGQVFHSISTMKFDTLNAVAGVGLRVQVPPHLLGRLDLSASADGFKIYTSLGYPF